MELKDVNLDRVKKAREALAHIVTCTDLSWSRELTQLLGCEIFIKHENNQRTGSFKIRGAYHKIINLSESEKRRGVVASSAGNHAQGVALSAQLAGVKATVVMPITAPLTKVSATKSHGANVILHGEIYDEAYAHARRLEQEQDLTFVHPYQDPFIVAGQGTLGLEIFEKNPHLESVVIPIGGGGLISGTALVLKALNPKIKIFGVQLNQTPGLYNMFKQNHLGDSSEVFQEANSLANRKISTIADGIAVKTPSAEMFQNFIKKYVDDIVTVNDDEIAEAIVFLLEKSKSVAEGAGAASLAAILHRNLPLGKQSCVVLSGGNIDLNIIAKVIEKGQIKRGRLIELSVIVDDAPGMLSKLTKVIADLRANILEVRHDRITQGLFLRETRIDFVLETSSHEHIQKIREAFHQLGAR